MPRANRTRHNPVPSATQIAAEVLSKMDAEPTAFIPPYAVAGLPWAANYPNSLVIVTDNPQGLARSVPVGTDWHWLSEVDGSDLGTGNASSS